MESNEMIVQILDIYDRIRPVLLSVLPQSSVAYKRERINAATLPALERTLKWIYAFEIVRVRPLIDAINLVSVEKWQSYCDLGITDEGIYEIGERAKATRAMIAAWKSRPNLLRKIKDKKQDGGTSGNHQSGKGARRSGRRKGASSGR